MEGPCHSVDHDPNKDIKFANNQYILQRIIESLVLCVEQGIALRGHREDQKSR